MRSHNGGTKCTCGIEKFVTVDKLLAISAL